MRNKCLSLVTCVAFALTAGSVLAQGMQPNSFIEKPTPTKQALIKHVQTNKVVMSRFMRHFGMTSDEVVAYFKSLHRGVILKDGAYLIYNTPESGEIRARVLFYRKGTAVWMDESGNYILKLSCGNPMVRGTDHADADDPETVALRTVTDARELVADIKPGIVTPIITETTVTPTLPSYDAITFEDTMPPMFPVETSSQGIDPIGLIIPFTSGILINAVPPIPEPASLFALGTGVIGLLSLRRRKKAQK